MLVLGSYAFAIPFISFIHELGHIIALNSIEITKYTLVNNPLAGFVTLAFRRIPHQHEQTLIQPTRDAYLVLGSGILAVLMCLIIF